MHQYSLVIHTLHGVAIPDPLLLLGEGVNVVSVFTDNIDQVKANIEAEGCDIKEVNLLEAEQTQINDLMIGDETSEQHGLLSSSDF